MPPLAHYDIVMLGTFAAWRLGTLQSRALPLAAELTHRGVRCAIVTTPWDMPSERGVVDLLDGVTLINTRSAPTRSPLSAVREQVALVRQLRPRAVHVFKPRGFAGFSGSLLHRRLPVLVDSDDWEGDGGWNRIGSYGLMQRRVFDWQERTLLSNAHAVTAASSLLFRRATCIREGRGVCLVPNGLTRAWFDTLASRQLTASSPARDRTIVLYSRFAEFGSQWLPRFLRALDEHISAPTRVDLIGATNATPASTTRLDVRAHGYVERDQVPIRLGAASVAVFPYEPSLVSLSKQSVKLLELMSAGCALVASDVGDIPAVMDGTGIAVDGADPVAFARVAARLLDDRESAAALGTAAQQRVRRHFLIETAIADRLLDAYRDAGVLPE
jgi:glycosyltransferase involved in cell wall biosynthesis